MAQVGKERKLMAYQSKTYSLSDEVIAAIAKGAKEYGSPNKFLKVKLLREDKPPHQRKGGKG